jgi:hypothetical protein
MTVLVDYRCTARGEVREAWVHTPPPATVTVEHVVRERGGCSRPWGFSHECRRGSPRRRRLRFQTAGRVLRCPAFALCRRLPLGYGPRRSSGGTVLSIGKGIARRSE